MRRKTLFGVMLAMALLSAAMLGSALAQTSTETLQLTPSRDSGVSGTATLTDTGAGVEVQLDVQGIPSAEGTEHIAHIHEGATCADDRAGAGGPVEFPLNSVFNEGGAGFSTSTADTTFDELLGGEPYYVNVHAEMTEGTPPGVACADIVAATMPATGGIVSPTTMLVLGGAALVLFATAAGGVLVRRRA